VNVEDREIREGNPELAPTLFRNIDFSMDMRVGDEGLVSLEVFDRAIDDFIFSRQSIISGGLYDRYELSRRENTASAQMRGAKITWSQPLQGMIFPDGMSFNANYTQQESELEYPARPGEILPMTRTPENELRLALNYESGNLFAQVKMSNTDAVIRNVTGSPESDSYDDARSSMDLSVSYKFRNKTRLYVEWDNITNEPHRAQYEGHPMRSAEYSYRPYSLAVGMKMEL